jgi:hypothetical protein
VELSVQNLRPFVLPLILAAWIGSVCGTAAIFILRLMDGGGSSQDIFNALLGVIVLSHVVVLPVTITGLALVGVPAALALRRHAQAWWMILLAIVAGGVAGRLVSHVLDLDRLGEGPDRMIDFGFAVGPLTGLLWLLFARPLMKNEVED